jgi:predicted permease
MDRLRQDLRDSLRSIAKNPGFAAVVVATLALGIGANVAIFTFLDQMLLRRLPVDRPEELVMLDGPGPNQGWTHNNHSFSYPMYRDFRDQNPVFAGVLARYETSATLAQGGTSERVDAELVSGNYFAVLGVPAALGRTLGPGDDTTPGGHPVVVLSHGYWQRRFGGDPLVLNQTAAVNGHPMTVVGVAAAGFYGLDLGGGPDLFVPIAMKAQMTPTWDEMENRRTRWLNVFARLKPGVTLEAAEEAMQPLYRGINEMEVQAIPTVSESFRQRFVAKRLELVPGTQGMPEMREQSSAPLAVLMGMVGLVLLIACANVASLLTARAQTRQREVAVRLALGAGRGHIVRQRLVESLLFAAGGAVLGLALSAWGCELLFRILPEEASRTLSPSPDLRVTLFTAAVAAATALVFGLAPALQATRPVLTRALREEAGAVAGGRRQARFRRVLVTGQVSALFARSLFNLAALDPGFEVDRLLTFSLDPSLSGYDTPRTRGFYDRLGEEVGALPGVRGVTLAAVPLLDGASWSSTVKVQGYESAEEENMNPEVNAVGAGYFGTLGVPLLAGREFTAADGPGAARVAIVNQTFARYFFKDADPVGRRFGFGRDEDDEIEIVGLVADAKSSSLREEIPRALWIPYLQDTDELGAMTFYVRHGAGDVAAGVRAAARRLDAGIPLYEVRTMAAQVGESLMIDRVVALLSTLFGALATLLAAVGLYGVMSYAVARRTREIGIRIALGAVKPAILWSVLREVALLAGIGLAVGLPAALGVGTLVKAQLFGLSPADPAALASTVVLLGTVAFAAGWVPARRATRVDPIRALRFE